MGNDPSKVGKRLLASALRVEALPDPWRARFYGFFAFQRIQMFIKSSTFREGFLRIVIENEIKSEERAKKELSN